MDEIQKDRTNDWGETVTTKLSWVCTCALLGVAVFLAACQGNQVTVLNAAGATFPYPIYSKWFDEYHTLHPDLQINYQSVGSGGAPIPFS